MTTCGAVLQLARRGGMGFAIAQARLGPGRIHHCMRAIGVAERALALMTERAPHPHRVRAAAGRSGHGQQQIALSRNEIDQARLLCERPPGPSTSTAIGRRSAWSRRSSRWRPRWPAPSSTAPSRCTAGTGVSDDFPLARMYGWQRAMRIFDGPDEVHLRTIARANSPARRAHWQRR